MSDRFPGELEWTDALQAERTEPTDWESLHGVMAHDNHGLCEKIDEQAAIIADLEAQNEALRTVVAAWGNDNDTGTLTLHDALDAVAVLNSARAVYAGGDVTLTGNEVRDALVRATAGIVRDQRIAQLERREALLTAFVVEWQNERCAKGGGAILTAYNRMLMCHKALTDAGFTADGWTEDKP